MNVKLNFVKVNFSKIGLWPFKNSMLINSSNRNDPFNCAHGRNTDDLKYLPWNSSTFVNAFSFCWCCSCKNHLRNPTASNICKLINQSMNLHAINWPSVHSMNCQFDQMSENTLSRDVILFCPHSWLSEKTFAGILMVVLCCASEKALVRWRSPYRRS